jgi:cold shock CspA family protein
MDSDLRDIPRETGVLTQWNQDKAFGFVIRVDSPRNEKRAFVHASRIRSGSPRPGVRCTYVRLSGPKGSYAVDVVVEDGVKGGHRD